MCSDIIERRSLSHDQAVIMSLINAVDLLQTNRDKNVYVFPLLPPEQESPTSK